MKRLLTPLLLLLLTPLLALAAPRPVQVQIVEFEYEFDKAGQLPAPGLPEVKSVENEPMGQVTRIVPVSRLSEYMENLRKEKAEDAPRRDYTLLDVGLAGSRARATHRVAEFTSAWRDGKALAKSLMAVDADEVAVGIKEEPSVLALKYNATILRQDGVTKLNGEELPSVRSLTTSGTVSIPEGDALLVTNIVRLREEKGFFGGVTKTNRFTAIAIYPGNPERK